MESSKKLILNADDYGSSREVNAAVEALAEKKLLGGVSVLANGSEWLAAASFLRQASGVNAGVHLNLVDGVPVSADPNVRILLNANGVFAGRQQVMWRWLKKPESIGPAVEIEWRAQIERLLQADLKLTHADSHQHFHAFPPAFRLIVKLCREYGITGLRVPSERNRNLQRSLQNLGLRSSLALAQLRTAKTGLKHNQHFLGFKRAGGYGLAVLLKDLQGLSPGITELALHPSLINHQPYQALRGYDEYTALCSQSFRDTIEAQQIRLIGWDEI